MIDDSPDSDAGAVKASAVSAAMLHEMDTALADEIAEAKSSKRSGHTAADGLLISELGGHYTYTFTLNDHWEPADDTPVVVKVRGNDAIRGTVVTALGSAITVATDQCLPEPVPNVTLLDDPIQLLERLRDALKEVDEGASQMGSKAFCLTPFSNGMFSTTPEFPGDPPYRAQLDAIRMALASEVTYVIGPPGTGKTATLAKMAYALAGMGRSVLIAAHTNIAVDHAILDVAAVMAEGSDQTPLREGRIIRYGTPQLGQVKETDDIYPPRIVKRQAQALAEQLTRLQCTRSHAVERLEQLARDRQGGSGGWQTERQRLVDLRNATSAELRALEERERERLSVLDRQIATAGASLAQVERRGRAARDDLARLVTEQTRAASAHADHLARIRELTDRLAQAQRTNAVLRVFKGLDPKRLADEIGTFKQRAWKEERTLRDIQSRMDVAHQSVATTEREADQARASHDGFVTARQSNTPDTERIAVLHESISQADSSIAAGDERNRQQTQEANAAERALRHSIELSNRQIAEIDEQIRDIEKRLLQDAQVVATTLSKVFMDETLSKRRFDVVILDEVSMAPLPAVYVAASHADRSVVAIGDPRQLPPIALGDTRMVRRWLKRDLFSVAGVRVGAPANQADRRCVLLDTQFRMHADIAAVSNKHVYDGSLRNGNRPQQESNEYGSVRPLPGKAILLCDTSDASPVASQPGGSSRVNFYHAICSVTIAREVLATLPPSHEPAQAGQPRIGVVTPYKKQAQLIHRLLKAERLDTQIRVGTVHRFQGLEFEVIVFDTVESPPVNPFHGFIGGGRRSESNGMRLVNVAITRPQHKLIIVANQKYVRAKFSPSDTLLQAIIEVGDSASLLSRDLLGSAAPAIEQTGVLDHLRVVPARYQPYDIDWLDETTFFPRLLDDIRHAQKQILIFSPFVRSNRAADLIPHLAAQCLAGIRTVVVASQPGTNNVTLDESAKDQLVRAGVDFRTSPGMHEKLVRIDHDIVYFGSLNPLSHGATSEVMMRLVSAECALQVEQLLRVGVRTAQARYGSEFALSIDQFPQPINCPICGGAMWRRHGKYGAFYSHSRRVLCQQTREVQENDLGAIQQLANILCIGCRRGNMKARAEGKNLWLECAAPAPCDFRRKIVVHPSATPSMASGAP